MLFRSSTLKGNEEAAAEANGDKGAAKDVTHDGFDKDHELRYGPRRTAVLFGLLGVVGVGVWLFFRWRSQRRQQRSRHRKGKGRAARRSERRAGSIRLETGAREDEAKREVPYHDPEPLETTPVFDVGEEDDYDEDAEDEEAYGDMGRSANPWQEDRK